MIQILFAIAAGILTIGAPCILPLLPILLGSSIGQTGKTRPLFITIGFVITFAALGLIFSLFANFLGLSQSALRIVAIVMLGIFGIFMIWPLPFELLTSYMNKYVNRANEIGKSAGSGNFGGFVLGTMLGVIWTPCAGPVLGSILTIVATRHNIGQSITLLIAYAIGAGIPMLIIAYGGQIVTAKVRGFAKYSRILQQVFGVLILLLAVAIYFQLDTVVSAKLADYFPSIATNFGAQEFGQNPSSTTTVTTGAYPTDLGNLGKAPEFTGINDWLNGSPQTIAGLKGHVVLVDFWTYSCINCIRTLPYVTKWYDTYKGQGLVVIGVHTPEFPFEKVSANVESAITRNNIHYPVAQDNEYATWDAYHNNSWPAEYLIDQNGNIVSEHFGEGNYDIEENNIRKLLGLTTAGTTVSTTPDFSAIQSPEMYFGTNRLVNLVPSQTPETTSTNYTLPSTVALNNFGLGGSWEFDPEKATLTSKTGAIKLNFTASNVYMVASAPTPVVLKIYVDGTYTQDVTVSSSQLYTLFSSSTYVNHTIEIDAQSTGLQAFTFTFG